MINRRDLNVYKLNEIFKLTTEQIENCRIELNMTEGAVGIAYINS